MGMQWFNTSYSAWFNARYNRVGSLWQGRYRDVLIENSSWAYELSAYIHLNPLRVSGLGLDKRGRMLEGKGFRVPTSEESRDRLRELREFRWSSYRAYAGYCRASTLSVGGPYVLRHDTQRGWYASGRHEAECCGYGGQALGNQAEAR